jgi:hypothetical protein
MSKYYLHSVGATGDIKDIDKSVRDLEGILSTGAILTRHRRNLLGFGFNGTKYISLSDYDKRFNHVYKDDPNFFDYTAYAMYSTKAVSILIDKKKVKAIKPTLVEPLDNSLLSFLKMYGAAHDLIGKRMSDLPDEVQVFGDIYYDTFRGVTIPIKDINEEYSIEKVKRVYRKIRELLKRYEYEMGIYDVDDLQHEIVSTKQIDNIIKRSR